MADSDLVPQGAVSTFPVSYFAQSQPSSALDMVMLLPGFTLREGNADLRGYSGSSGNVLIDGQRPISKQESIKDVLARIPAAGVDHIELIRSGSGAYDMQNFALLANVVRKRDSKIGGRLKVEDGLYVRGHHAPRLSGELNYNAGDHFLDLAGALYREIDDEKGYGVRNRYAADGQPLRLGAYDEPEHRDVRELSAKYRQELAEGTLQLNGLVKDEREQADISHRIVFPYPFEIETTEQEDSLALELGATYERPIGADRQLEILGIQRMTDIDATDRSMDADGIAIAAEASRAKETTLRGTLRQQRAALTLEGGVEATLNTFDSHVALEENGAAIPLPAASVRVQEKRLEAFATSTWRATASLLLETGLRYEISGLNQSGDSDLSKTLKFLKPRAMLRWTPGPKNEWRMLGEREVGQLDFEDFISSASLTSDSITAGNKELEPASLWRLELAWEHHFEDGSLVIAARHEMISDVVDRVPVFEGTEVFDSVGNIGNGRRDELEIDLNLPLARFGLQNLTLQANNIFRHSRVDDPSTGTRRTITDDKPVEGEISLTYDLPALDMRLGGNYKFGEKETSYKIDEIEEKRVSEQLDLFIEYKPDERWVLRAFANNLTNGAVTKHRSLYEGMRGQTSVDHSDIKILKSGRAFGVSLEWIFN